MSFRILTIIFFVSFCFVNLFPQLPGQVPINPKSIPQFVDRLPHFAGARVDATSPNTHLTITMLPHKQVALSTGTVVNGGTVGTPGVGLANVWAYKIDDGSNSYGPLWPAYTILAKRGVPLNVTYVNGLNGEKYDSVGLVVDQTLHWANPNDLAMNSINRFNPYTDEPPAVTHLHGGEVASESDGGPDAWFTPGKAKTGPSWGIGGTDDQYFYPNTQEAATLWFHDHALGVTRLNVYAGLAGFYFLTDNAEDALHLPGWSGDNKVQEVDRVTGQPVGSSYLPEIEIVIQDRMFDTDGKLYLPNLPTNPTVHPYWTPEFVGDIITVNGKTWPYLSVAPRKYRFRFLNGSNARFYELWLQDLATKNFGPVIYQIGTDGGLLDAPAAIDPALGGKLIFAPGERADVVIDFSGSAPGTVWTLRNSGRAPYDKGAPPNGATVGRIMQFVVNGAGADNSQLPASLRSTPLVKLTNFAGGLNVTPDITRQLTLNEVMGMGGPLEVLVNNTKWDANGEAPGLGITEKPTEGNTEVWQIINLTADAHPIHLHLIQFQLVSRQNFNMSKYLKVYNAMPGEGPPNDYDTPNNDNAVGGNPAVTPYLQGPVNAANPNEMGWKDTFIMYPGQVTTVVARFAPTYKSLSTQKGDLLFGFDPSIGPGYVWHCHIIDHEDNEMMRPYMVYPNPSRSTLPGIASATNENISIKTSPVSYNMQQNYPNPFNPSTVIRFSIPEDAFVTLKIYDILGREVGTLLNQVIPGGSHEVRFDGSKLSSGIYIYTLRSGSFIKSYKMVLAK
jgi:spore coat protein A